MDSSAPSPSAASILFLMADQFDGRLLDPHHSHSQRVRLPSLTSLAADGVNFRQAYAPSPLCAPSRLALLSGRSLGQFGILSEPLARPDLLELLSAGLATPAGVFGKVYEPSWERLSPWANRKLVWPRGADVHRPNSCVAARRFWHLDLATCDAPRSSSYVALHSPIRVANLSSIPNRARDYQTVDSCIDYLHRLGGARNGAPWVLACSLRLPHPSYATNDEWASFVNVSALPSGPVRLPRRVHPWDAFMSQSKGDEVARAEYTEHLSAVRRAYYAMCAETDALLGRVVDAARRTGALDGGALVVFTSDHGELAGEHGQLGKSSLYEGSVRIPLIMAGYGLAPGRVARGSVVSQPVSNVDVYATLLSFAGRSSWPPSDSVSLAPLLLNSSHEAAAAETGTGVASPPRAEYVTAQYHDVYSNTGAVMLRHGRYKYIAFGHQPAQSFSAGAQGYQPQLFDVEADPEELIDLAARLPSVCSSLERLLRSALASGPAPLSPNGSFDEIDCLVKRTQRQSFISQYGTRLTSEASWARVAEGWVGADAADQLKVAQWLALDALCGGGSDSGELSSPGQRWCSSSLVWTGAALLLAVAAVATAILCFIMTSSPQPRSAPREAHTFASSCREAIEMQQCDLPMDADAAMHCAASSSHAGSSGYDVRLNSAAILSGSRHATVEDCR
jgi:arylsulfatase K